VRRLLVLLLFLAVAADARASLGESSDRVEDAYGNLVGRRLLDDGAVAVVYHKDRYIYSVIFDHGVSISETYSRADRADLSEKEIARFLKANAGGGKWIRDQASKEPRFERSDQGAKATVGKGFLKVESRKENTRERERE
jgi:hypothetical protein